MAKLWFDCSGVLDGETPSWVGTPPSLVTAKAAGRVLQIRDLRTVEAFWYSGVLATAADVDVVLKFRACSAASANYANARIGAWARKSAGSYTGNYYAGSAGTGANYRTTLLRLRPSGANTDYQVTDAYPTSQEAHVWRFLRFQATGTTVRLRAWDETESEPGTWDESRTETVLTAAGEVIVTFPFVVGHMTELAYVAVGTAGDSAPSESTYSVSGVVLDAAGAPVQRTVRLVHRVTGKVIAQTTSNATTGIYTLPSPFTDEVQVICLDNDAGSLENDLIHRTFPV